MNFKPLEISLQIQKIQDFTRKSEQPTINHSLSKLLRIVFENETTVGNWPKRTESNQAEILDQLIEIKIVCHIFLLFGYYEYKNINYVFYVYKSLRY